MPACKSLVAAFIPRHSGLTVVGSLCASKILRRPANNSPIKHKVMLK